MVSNCRNAPSHRGELVTELRAAGLPIDQFGKCNKRDCDRQGSEALRSDCDDMLRKVRGKKAEIQNENGMESLKHYRVYLALENTSCRDYITEKFFARLGLAVKSLAECPTPLWTGWSWGPCPLSSRGGPTPTRASPRTPSLPRTTLHPPKAGRLRPCLP